MAKEWTLRIDWRGVRSPTSWRSRGSAVILESPAFKRFEYSVAYAKGVGVRLPSGDSEKCGIKAIVASFVTPDEQNSLTTRIDRSSFDSCNLSMTRV